LRDPQRRASARGPQILPFTSIDDARSSQTMPHRTLCAAAPRHRRSGRGVHIGNFVEVKAAGIGGRRQGQPPVPMSATRSSGAGQHRRRHHHLQLRRRQQAPHRHRGRRLHRLGHRSWSRRCAVGARRHSSAAGTTVCKDVPADSLVLAAPSDEVAAALAAPGREAPKG
jgi:hypothetical protein